MRIIKLVAAAFKLQHLYNQDLEGTRSSDCGGQHVASSERALGAHTAITTGMVGPVWKLFHTIIPTYELKKALKLTRIERMPQMLLHHN